MLDNYLHHLCISLKNYFIEKEKLYKYTQSHIDIGSDFSVPIFIPVYCGILI